MIWTKGNNPERCPDGTWPGSLDQFGVPIDCLECKNPERSKDGSCDNKRSIDHMIDNFNDKKETMMMGLNPNASPYGKDQNQDIEDCITSASLCLGVEDFQVNRTLFTMGDWIYREKDSEYCLKSSLYCMDACQCQSYCITFPSLLLGLLIGIPGGLIPIFLALFLAQKVYNFRFKIVDTIGIVQCLSKKKSHNCSSTDNFCRECGTVTENGINNGFDQRYINTIRDQSQDSIQEVGQE